MRTFCSFLCLLLVSCAVSENRSTFQSQFDHFYPDDPRYINKFYRDGYTKVIANPSCYGDLGAASIGDRAALHRFLSRASAEGNRLDGERGETYAYDLRFLLIRLGDHPFAQALLQLTRREREAVAPFLDSLINREREWFPETASTYKYRYQRTQTSNRR
jgi:hypothetical protein